MKTAISVPDDVFRKAERLARRRKMSRSELYTTALVRLLAEEPKDDLTQAYDSAFADETEGPLVRSAAERVLLATEWDEGG